MRRSVAFTALMFLAPLAACQAPAPEVGPLSEEDVAAIRALDAQWAEAELAGNWDGVAAVMAEDVINMPPDMPAMVGLAAWREHVESLDMTVTQLTATTLEIDGLGTLAYLRGAYSQTYTVGEAPEPISVTGKHLATLPRHTLDLELRRAGCPASRGSARVVAQEGGSTGAALPSAQLTHRRFALLARRRAGWSITCILKLPPRRSPGSNSTGHRSTHNTGGSSWQTSRSKKAAPSASSSRTTMATCIPPIRGLMPCGTLGRATWWPIGLG